MTTDDIILDAGRIMDLLPHRYPFLLIDRITACQPGESITALKNVTINEPFSKGTFPEDRLCLASSLSKRWHRLVASCLM